MIRKEEIRKLENGFFKHNHYHVEKIKEKEIVLKADITDTSNNPYGFTHGGFIFGLGDTLMGILAYRSGKKAVTLDANISYLKPGTGKYLIAKGQIIKEGSNICFTKSDIYNDQKELVATLTGTYYYIEKKGKMTENDR